jgi:predicted permease
VGSTGGQHQFLRSLAVAEVALSLTLLLGAGLVVRGFVALVSQPPGFDPAPILTLSVSSPAPGASQRASDRFFGPALDAVRRVPGVEDAAAISSAPYLSWGVNSSIEYEGRPPVDAAHRILVENRVVSPGFFPALGIPLVAGRLIGPSDREGALVVTMVNRALVRRDFPGQDPIGKRFQIGDTTFATIIGVVGDIKNFGPDAPPAPEVYYSFDQAAPDAERYTFMIRTRGSPASVADAVVAAIRSVDRGAAVNRIRPMDEVIARSVGRPRFYMTLLAVFALVAVVLAMAGLYGLMSYSVAQRRREIGIRMALGSSSGRTMGLVIGQGGRIAGLGVVLGLGAGLVVTRALSSMLYGVSPRDPVTWAGVVALLFATALVALWIPARRAIRTDPVTVIRDG